MANDALTATSPDLVPVAFLGRTSTLAMQDPAASLSRQLREVKAKLPAGWFVAATTGTSSPATSTWTSVTVLAI